MKNILMTSIATALLLSSCGSASKVSDNHTDTVAVAKDTSLTAILRAGAEAKLSDSVKVNFIVYNRTDSVRKFCKWHTPFEPLLSKYLDVVASDGTEAQYQGPMAKRIMPPPADSYISIQPGDSLAAEVNVSKAYQLTGPGKYTIKYNGSGLSGIVVRDSVTIDVK